MMLTVPYGFGRCNNTKSSFRGLESLCTTRRLAAAQRFRQNQKRRLRCKHVRALLRFRSGLMEFLIKGESQIGELCASSFPRLTGRLINFHLIYIHN